MSGRAELLKLASSEDVNGDQVDLGVSVLASLNRGQLERSRACLGGGHLNDLAGTVLNHNETTLAQRRALRVRFEHGPSNLLGNGLGGTRLGGLELRFVLNVRHGCSVNIQPFVKKKREKTWKSKWQLGKRGVMTGVRILGKC